MGMKLYILDDKDRKFSNLEWAFTDTKALASILVNADYLRVFQAHFRLNVLALNRVQY